MYHRATMISLECLSPESPTPLLTPGLPHDPRKYREAGIHTGCFIDRLMSDSCTPTSPYLFYNSRRKWCSPAKPSQGTWVVISLDSQTTSTRRLGRTENPGPQGQGAGEVAEESGGSTAIPCLGCQEPSPEKTGT